MTLRPCLECGKPSHEARCPAHHVDTRGAYASPEYQEARRTLLANATVCEHCGHPPTPTDPLEADHDPPLIHAGGTWQGRLIASHQSCNRSRGATTRGDSRPVNLDAVDPTPGGPENLSQPNLLSYCARSENPAAKLGARSRGLGHQGRRLFA